jgi:hypothetical protein
MRNRNLTQKLLAALLALTPLGLTSCEVAVNFWDQRTFTVNLQGTDTTAASMQTVDLSQDPAVQTAVDSISNLQILSLWVQVTNVYADDTDPNQTVSGMVTISDPTDSTWTPITIAYNNVPVSLNSQVELTPNPDQVTAIATLLQTKHKLQAQYAGSVSSLPAHFDFQGKINISAMINTNAL